MQPRPLIGALVAALALSALPVAAQDTANRSAPSAPRNVTLLGIPSATVAPGGLGFASLSGTTRRAGNSDFDGSAALGLGFGDAGDGIGVQATALITSLTDDFADSGYFEIKASTQVADGAVPTFVGLSFGQLANWGDANGRDVTARAMVTGFTLLDLAPGGDPYPVMFTLGAGTDVRNNGNDPGVFFGAGIGLTPTLGASLAWTGETVSLGASFRPRGVQNLDMSVTVDDLFDQENSQRVTFSVNVYADLFGG
ncbi:hypothetical protein DXV76_10580 [Rhodobacteraceae bacterium CCMM004]|nr:hypothetical protein DXV76_10580 [Rhodobacteraceae bacterium CCMM004]